MQDSYVRMINATPDGLTDRQLKSYLYQTGTRIFYDHLRAVKRSRRWFADPENEAGHSEDEITGPRMSNPTTSVNDDLQFALSRAFRDLTVQERSLLWLAHVDRYTHDEIAVILGLGKGSVKVMLFRARKRMKKVLESMGIQSLGDI